MLKAVRNQINNLRYLALDIFKLIAIVDWHVLMKSGSPPVLMLSRYNLP